ncbi:MAG: fasciclin protein [Proteobacteria bacterium]|nr:fasciclin protein [Pseudomonadota bacterium]
MNMHSIGAYLIAGALVGAGAAAVPGVADAKGKNSPVPGKPGDQNIVEIASAVNQQTGEFEYLLAAVGCLTDPVTGDNPVVDVLTGEDKVTLFAPTDAAFENLQTALEIETPAPDLTCRLGPETVADVLTYHVTDGRRFSNSVFNKNRQKDIEMLNGEWITTNPNLTINDVAGQTIGVVPDFVNINASNGVIHVIDTVMLPFAP